MRALVTGASSGIGRDMARTLSNMGYDIIAVARDKEALSKLKEELPTHIEIITLDLTSQKACKELYEQVKHFKCSINCRVYARTTYGNILFYQSLYSKINTEV